MTTNVFIFFSKHEFYIVSYPKLAGLAVGVGAALLAIACWSCSNFNP